MIKAENISKKYEGKTVIENFSFDFPDKGIVSVVGKSGSGKTTLIKILAGLVKPDGGRLEKKKNPLILSMVFQEDRLLKWESAIDNAAISSEKNGAVKSEVYEKARAILKELDLAEDIDTKVSELSGGMARRTAIARALTVDADIYFMDEPIKGLDAETARKTLEVIKKYTAEKLLVIATHNQNEIDMADFVVNVC